jgi:hypothetical protein
MGCRDLVNLRLSLILRREKTVISVGDSLWVCGNSEQALCGPSIPNPFRLLHASEGITGPVTRLLSLAAVKAIRNSAEQIDEAGIDRAATRLERDPVLA